MKKIGLSLAGVMALIATACGSSKEAADTDTSRVERAAVAPTCADTVLPTSSSACRGSWSYVPVTCAPRYQRCESPQFGQAGEWDPSTGEFFPYSVGIPDAQHVVLEANVQCSARWYQNCAGGRIPPEIQQTLDRMKSQYYQRELDRLNKGNPIPGFKLGYSQEQFRADQLQPGFEFDASSGRWVQQQRINASTLRIKMTFNFARDQYNEAEAAPCPVVGLNYGSCTVSNQTTYTPSGLTLQQMRQQFPTAPTDDILANVPAARAPVCTTHDSLAIDPVKAKFDAVESDFRTADAAISGNLAVRADALGKMVTELSTLFLLRTAQFDNDMIVRFTKILARNPQVVALCGTKYQVLETLFARPLGASTDEGRREEATARLSLLVDVLSASVPDADADRRSENGRRIRLIGKWYATSVASGVVATSRDGDDASVVSAFYGGVYAPEIAKLKSLAGGTTSDDVLARGQALQELVARNFRADREILAALYPHVDPQDPTTNDLPISGPMAARLTGSALVGIAQRLRVLGALHDYACAFVDCTQAMPATETTKGIWRLLAGLPVPQDLQSAIDALPASNEWRLALQGISEHHTAFLQSVGAQAPTNTFGVPATTAPPYAADLARVVEDARLRMTAFAKTGSFELAGRNTLQQSLDEVRVDSQPITSALSTTAGALSSLLSTYTNHRDALVTRLAGEIDDAAREKATAAQVAETITGINITSDELAALRQHTNEDAAKFGDFLRALGTTVDKEGLDDQRIARDNPVIFTAKAAGSHVGTDLRQLAITTSSTGGTAIPAKRGDFVNLQVEGDWSPVCAIKSSFDARKTAFNSAPAAAGKQLDVKYAVTGPEGYQQQTADDSVLTVGKSNTQSDTTTTGSRLSASICIEAETGSPGFAKAVLGSSVTIKASACASAYRDTSSSSVSANTAGSSDSVRRSASFASGIRVPGTVNAQMPAGSLLMYTMPRGAYDIGQALDVQVVHRNDGVLIQATPGNADVDLYFVVNDSTCSDANGQLTVTLQKYTTAGAVAKEVGAKMASALEAMRASGDIYAKQGAILPAETAALRDQAKNAVGTDLGRMPDVIKGLFDLWVDVELARIERSVEIRKHVLAIDSYVRQLGTIRETLDAQTAKNRLSAQLSYWSLQALESDDLTFPMRDVTTAYASRLRSVLRLRYPTLVSCLGGKAPVGAPNEQITACAQAQTDFNRLLNATTTQPINELAAALVKSTDDVRSIITKYDPHIQTQRLDIAVRVPNPFVKYCGSDGGWDGAAVGDCVQRIRTVEEDATIARTRLTSNPIVARAMWSALLGPAVTGGPAPQEGTFFRLSPEDIYSSVTADKNNSLPCNQGAPIVNQMAIVVGNSGEGKDTINAAQKAGVVSRETTFVFTTNQGPELFDLQVGGAQNSTFNVPLLDSHYNTYMTTYNSERTGPSGSRFNVPLSTSPFTGYRLLVSDTARAVFGTQLTTSPEVYLMMTTDVLPLSNVSWVTSCR